MRVVASAKIATLEEHVSDSWESQQEQGGGLASGSPHNALVKRHNGEAAEILEVSDGVHGPYTCW